MKKEIKIGNESFIIETGKMAKQSAGAVTVCCGGTVVLVAVTWNKKAKENCDFLPLTVDYREKTYAAGRIPGGFFKREGRPTEKEILSSRLIDRTIRVLFPKNFNHEIQIIAIVLSADGKNEPDWLAINGASTALLLSDIPFPNPAAAIRIGKTKNGEFIINPSYSQLEKNELNLVAGGTKDSLLMLEGEAKEIDEENLLEGIKIAQEQIEKIIVLQEEVAREQAKEKDKEACSEKTDSSFLYAKLEASAAKQIKEIVQIREDEEREEKFALLVANIKKELTQEKQLNLSSEQISSEEGTLFKEKDIELILEDLKRKEVRRLITEKEIRLDGRALNEVREIDCEVGLLPCTHGSALFTRGRTQSLAVITLGTKVDEQIVESLEGESRKKFMLHYNFPPFSVGEVRQVRGPGRREIGHGMLAERALKPILPEESEFPYTTRIVSDILESNGSSSMATVCAGSLALMDAGVPVKTAVAGVALGLIKESDKTVILTDIAGSEDHYGDMDLKIAGTAYGITAIQMDLKIAGIKMNTLYLAFKQSKEGRLAILEKMNNVINESRKELSPYAPRITILEVNPNKVGSVIGPAGKTIKEIVRKTGVKIDIDDDGKVMIASPDKKASEEAIAMVKKLTEEAELGKIYLAKVKKITDFGAFCEILPGQDGLVHISELSNGYVGKVEDVLKLGGEVLVKVIRIDEQGKISLSKKQAEKK